MCIRDRPHRLAHAADLPVAPFKQHKPQDGSVLPLGHCLYFAGAGLSAVQLYAGGHPGQLLFVGPAPDGDPVDLGDVPGGVGQQVDKLPVVAHEEQSLRILVQPPHRQQPPARCV